jgi:CheY-like chemotaxis protein
MHYQKILHIDDDEEDQEIFLSVIKDISNSITCFSFNNALEALKQLIENKIHPEIIFIDFHMPIMNGLQFLTEIKKIEAYKNTPVIVFSTFADYKTIQLLKAAGANDFIAKPDTFNQLINLLKPLLSKSTEGHTY